MSEGWQRTLLGLAAGVAITLLGWGVAELRDFRSEVNQQFDRVEQRLDALERNAALLLERTAPLAPSGAKPRK